MPTGIAKNPAAKAAKIAAAFRGRKYSAERRRKMSESHMGEKHYQFGRHRTDEEKKKLSAALKGRPGNKRTEEIIKKFLVSMQEYYKSDRWAERRKRMDEKRIGCPDVVEQLRKCIKYRQWRSDIFTRDCFSCILCGARGGAGRIVRLEADHFPERFIDIYKRNGVDSFESGWLCEEFWNINNGRTLCGACHKRAHGKKPSGLIE